MVQGLKTQYFHSSQNRQESTTLGENSNQRDPLYLVMPSPFWPLNHGVPETFVILFKFNGGDLNLFLKIGSIIPEDTFAIKWDC